MPTSVAPHLRALATDGTTSATTPQPVELADELIELLDSCGCVRWVVYVDDLHWADRATLDVLLLVLRRLGERQVLLVGAYRPVELVPTC
ncbi:MAG: hypothetical protein R2697_16030 [Ilumatobacteraceae bacterium]